MKIKIGKRVIAFVMALALVLSGTASIDAQAARKATVKLNRKTVSVVKGKKVTLKIKKSNVKKVKSTKWSSGNKKVATVSKKGVITAKKKGSAKITCTVKYKAKGAKKFVTKKLVCKVTVKNKTTVPKTDPTVTPSNPTTEVPTPTTPPQQENYDVVTKTYNDVSVHSYLSGDISLVVVETSEKLVVIDIPGSADTAKFKRYVESLKKPVDSIIISHADTDHWNGVDSLFPNVPLYSTNADAIKAAEAGKNLNVQQITDGEHTYAGVKFDFATYNDMGTRGAYVIKLPDQKAVFFDHLGYLGLHVLLAPLNERLDVMKGLQEEGYTWFMAGHGEPGEAASFVSQVEAYFVDVQTAIANNSTAEGAKADIMAKYPNYYSGELLDIMLPAFYQ